MRITLLHLSDIHFHNHPNRITDKAEEIATTCFTEARQSDAIFIVVTGDIAYSGAADEYKVAKDFLQLIKSKISDETKHFVEIVLVPGNHDCQLKPEKKARSLLINNVIENPDYAEDDSVVDSCVEAQENYFDFRNELTTTPPKYDHKLYTEYEFLVADKVVRFSAINASWMSRIPENAGQLVYPANKFKDIISEPAEIRFVLLHHPLHWYCPSSFHELRSIIRTHATAVLSGHEHQTNASEIKEHNSGTSFYFEAGALQPHETNLDSTYSILSFDYCKDVEKRNVHQYEFKVDSNNITLTKESTIALNNANSNVVSGLSLKKEFVKVISDPGGGFIHPEKEYLNLEDIFVYPELKKKKSNDEKESVKSNQYSVTSEEILYSGEEHLRLLLLGEEKSGKSSLIYQAFREFHSRGFAPLLIKATDISSLGEADFERHVSRCVSDQYVKPENFERIEVKKKVVFVDDLDRLRGGLKMILKLIKLLEQQFDSIILVASTGFEITEFIIKEASQILKNYNTFEITRFGHALRLKLIRKWCLCGSANTLAELDRQIYETENIVNIVVGRNLVPSQPFYLLILLQSSSQNQQAELKNSSFAQYYEYLMTGNLTKSGVKRDQYDDLFNYLSNLAWLFRTTDITEASLSELQGFNDNYSKLFYRVDLQPRLDLLVAAKLLKKRGTNYSFAYPYVFFFFLGRYLAKNLHKSEIKATVIDWCSQLTRKNNAHAILFLTYHVNDPWIIEQIASVLSNCFSGINPVQFNGDITFINELIENTTEQLMKLENRDVQVNQTEIRELRDRQDSLEEDNDRLEEDNLVEVSIFKELNLFIKTAEILGQIVKNYYGSLERVTKKQLIKEVFDAPLRFLHFLFELIHGDPDAFVLEIEKIILLKNPGLESLNKRLVARNIAYRVLGQISTGMILRSSANISSDKLDDDLLDLTNEHPNAAYKLLRMSAKFISPKNLPLDEIRRLANELKPNPFAFGILQSLGAMHIHQFHLEIEDRQKLCSILGISIENTEVIEYRTKDSKLIKN